MNRAVWLESTILSIFVLATASFASLGVFDDFPQPAINVASPIQELLVRSRHLLLLTLTSTAGLHST